MILIGTIIGILVVILFLIIIVIYCNIFYESLKCKHSYELIEKIRIVDREKNDLILGYEHIYECVHCRKCKQNSIKIKY